MNIYYLNKLTLKKLIFIFGGIVFIKCSAPSEKRFNNPDSVIASIKPLINAAVQKTKININEFIPKGFSILDSLSGNLNLDSYPDMLLILKQDGEDSLYDINRPLLILTGQNNNSYKLEAHNDSVVLCRNCGGVFGDPYESSVIKGGYFSIQHYGGSNWRWTRIITFKYIKEKNIFVLHRDAGESYHTSEPDKTTPIISNKKDYGVLSFEKFSNAKGF